MRSGAWVRGKSLSGEIGVFAVYSRLEWEGKASLRESLHHRGTEEQRACVLRLTLGIIPPLSLSFLESQRLRCVQSLHPSYLRELVYGPLSPPFLVCLFRSPYIGIG